MADEVSRRKFLKQAAAVGGAAVLAGCGAKTPGQGRLEESGRRPYVAIQTERGDPVGNAPPVKSAISMLSHALRERGIPELPPLSDFSPTQRIFVIVAGDQSQLARSFLKSTNVVVPQEAESLALIPGTTYNFPAILATAPDSRGLAYAVTELADRIQHAVDPWQSLHLSGPVVERPANRQRGIIRVFVSEMEDKKWYYDRAGWQKFFDMLVMNRYNRFNLSLGLAYDFSTRVSDAYFFFAYPFFLNVSGYEVRAMARGGVPLAEEEQRKNLETLRFISDEATARGIHFQLGLWTHSFQWPATANYTIAGLTQAKQAEYSRDGLHGILEACPNIKGVTIRTHGESGVPEGNFDLWKVIFTGVQGLKNAESAGGGTRVVGIDLHAKGLKQEIIDYALATGAPLTITPKFWAEHMGLPYMQSSIRATELPKERDGTGLMAISTGTRNFLRYGYGDLLKQDRKYQVIHRVFPGTQKLLLWGDPLFAREYGRNFSFSGTDGVEYFEPLSFKGRCGSSWEVNRGCYEDATLKPETYGQLEWEKYSYTYRLWGRLAYNPDADAEVLKREFAREVRGAAKSNAAAEETLVGLESALGQASRILPLVLTAHCPSAAHANYVPEIYSNQSIYDAARPVFDDMGMPRIFTAVSSLDPQIFANCGEYAEALLVGKPIAKITPYQIADQLDRWADSSTALFNWLNGRVKKEQVWYRRMSIDSAIARGLGQFFAAKFRAGVMWVIFDRTGHEPARQAALAEYSKARDAWAELAQRGKGVYRDNIAFGDDMKLHGCWSDRLAGIDSDISGMRTWAPAAPNGDKTAAARAMGKVGASVKAGSLPVTHAPPASFKPGQPLVIQVATTRAAKGDLSVRLWYRHADQAETYQSVEMSGRGGLYEVSVPGEYTNTVYPLEYYFEVHTSPEAAALYPGFREDFVGQPYFIVQPA